MYKFTLISILVYYLLIQFSCINFRVFFCPAVDPLSPSPLVGMYVVVDLVFRPAVPSFHLVVNQPLIVCHYRVQALPTIPPVVSFVVLVKSAPFPFPRSCVLCQELVWDIIPSITLQKLASLACHSARHGNVLAVRHP